MLLFHIYSGQLFFTAALLVLLDVLFNRTKRALRNYIGARASRPQQSGVPPDCHRSPSETFGDCGRDGRAPTARLF